MYDVRFGYMEALCVVSSFAGNKQFRFQSSFWYLQIRFQMNRSALIGVDDSDPDIINIQFLDKEKKNEEKR